MSKNNLHSWTKRGLSCDNSCNSKPSFLRTLAHRIQHLPTALTGLALGLCGIAAVLDTIFKQYYVHPRTDWWISIGFIAVATVLLLLATIRNCVHPKVLGFDTKDPLLSSFLPTYSMTLMCIAGFIAGWQVGDGFGKTPPCQVIGAIIMCLAVLIQIVFIVYFAKNVLAKHKWHEHSMYGSWLVPTVGPATASTFAGRFDEHILPIGFFQAIWFFAFSTYIVLFIIVTYALLFKKQPDKEKFPSIAVYFAPPNLVLAGFLQAFAIPSVNHLYDHTPEVVAFSGANHDFINVMLILMGCMAFTYTIVLWFFVVKIFIGNKFGYIFAALTFPLAIGAASMVYMHGYLVKYGVYIYGANIPHALTILTEFFQYIGYIFTTVATCIIIFIAIRFIINIIKALATTINDDKKHKVYCCEPEEVVVEEKIIDVKK